MNNFDYGPLTPFIEDPLVTDINYNGTTLWIDHLEKGRYAPDFDEHMFMQQFCFKIANEVNLPFNVTSPLVEAETKELRISLIHESIAKSGNSVSIRKTPATLRMNRRSMITSKYTTAAVLDFLTSVVESRCNVLICGLPGVGKTELIKYLTNFIESNERVITIEDTLELRYHDIYDFKDCVALKVNNRFTYSDAIKASLRQKPNWLLVSEVRGNEVVHLLEAISTGASVLSTIHTNDAKKIPKRILYMMPNADLSDEVLLQNIHDAIDIGIAIHSDIQKNGVKRYIQEIVAFDTEGDKANTYVLYERGKPCNPFDYLPESLKPKFALSDQKKKRK